MYLMKQVKNKLKAVAHKNYNYIQLLQLFEMRKKQITSPTKISVKQSPIIAKFGPQQVIISDTSLRNNQQGESSGTISNRFQKSNKNIQQKQPLFQSLAKKAKAQSIEYNSTFGLPRNQTQNNKSLKMEQDPLGDIEEQIITGNNQYKINKGAQAKSNEMDDDQNGELVEKQYTFSNGDVYIGTWRGKMIQGYGVYNFNKQNLQYRGQFKKNKNHGTGVLLRKPGGNQTKQQQIYDGEWMNGQKHGLGKYYYYKDVYYDGNWVRNKKEGHGTFKSPEGEYVGQWKNDKKDGKGVLKLKNGHVFQGIWVMDQFLEGVLVHSNGDRYQGEFQNFMRHGYGTYYYSNKSKYRGYWQHNQKHGKGEIQYFNGDFYQGTLSENARSDADALYRWQSSQQIIAQFQNDLPIRGKVRLPAEGQSQFNLMK